jgi:outer membrane protein TolC
MLLGLATPREAVAAVLSLEDCLEIAGQNHPSIVGAAASVASQKGRVAQIAAGDRLSASGSASASRSGSESREGANFSIGVTAEIKLYDSGRSKYELESSRHTLSAAELEALRTATGVRSDVKSAFMTLALNKEIAGQRLESVKAFEHHLEQAKGFYEAGSKPWYDVTKAEVDLGNAQLSLVEAESNVRIARASLANAMGIDQREEIDIAPTDLDILAAPDGIEAEAANLALENRPDYKASEMKIMAGRSGLSAEARSNSPTVSLSGGYDGSGEDAFGLGMGWNTGIRMSIPIIDGGASKAKIDVARAQVTSLESSHEKLRQDITLEVSKAATDLAKARERIRISGLTLASAEENRKMAVGRYETGVGDPLEVTDAILSYTDAVLSSKQAMHDLQAAIINLEKATGVEFDQP